MFLGGRALTWQLPTQRGSKTLNAAASLSYTVLHRGLDFKPTHPRRSSYYGERDRDERFVGSVIFLYRKFAP